MIGFQKSGKLELILLDHSIDLYQLSSSDDIDFEGFHNKK